MLALVHGGAALAGKTATPVTASSNDAIDLTLDTMLAAGGAGRALPLQGAAPESARAELARMLRASVAAGGIGDQDRSSLLRRAAERTGSSPQDAEKRVSAAFNAAPAAAEQARHGAILSGLVTAASLIIGFGAAWWGARKGEQHRDCGVPARFVLNHRRRPA